MIGHGTKFNRKMEAAVAVLLTQKNKDEAAREACYSSCNWFQKENQVGWSPDSHPIHTRRAAKTKSLPLQGTLPGNWTAASGIASHGLPGRPIGQNQK
jgi:hypothetical protein